MAKCPECKTHVRVNDIFCQKCGHQLKSTPEEKKAKGSSEAKNEIKEESEKEVYSNPPEQEESKEEKRTEVKETIINPESRVYTVELAHPVGTGIALGFGFFIFTVLITFILLLLFGSAIAGFIHSIFY